MKVGYILWLVRDTDNYTGCSFSQYKAQGGLAHRENACQGLHSFCPAWWHGPERKRCYHEGILIRIKPCSDHYWLVDSWNWCATSVIGYKLWSTYQSWTLYSQNWHRGSIWEERCGYKLCYWRRQEDSSWHWDFLQYYSGGNANECGRPYLIPGIR